MHKTSKQPSDAILQSAFYRYHVDTKHTLEKLTANTHRLDWDNQPNPFRTYLGSERVNLPIQIPPPVQENYFECVSALANEDDIGQTNSASCNLETLSGLLFHSMAVSAWKQIKGTNHRWALRVNPSSGNLHPTDVHLLLDHVDGIASGDYHYLVSEHKLERRSSRGQSANQLWQTLGGSGNPAFCICLTSVFWRESWKYQSRAFRYCQHDLGHALAALTLAAAAYGWQTDVIAEFPDHELANYLGLGGSDERPLLVLAFFPTPVSDIKNPEFLANSKDAFETNEQFQGKPNALSVVQVDYPLINRVYESTVLDFSLWRERVQKRIHLPITPSVSFSNERAIISLDRGTISGADFSPLVRARRSAVDMDGQQRMTQDDLAQILYSCSRGFKADFHSPISNRDTKTTLAGAPQPSGHRLIHLFLYIHKVDGIGPGAYYYDPIKEALLLLRKGDVRSSAKFVSCMQDIAADGCFAVSMVANLGLAYELWGNRAYRYVHYEAGFIGQLLYLSGQALGYESTGIGCFMDDEVNTFFELEPGFEVVYNFTTGRAVLDPRLTDLPAYDFLNN